jgi:hypothetical protein
MSVNDENQSKTKEKSSEQNHYDTSNSANTIDIFCLINLQTELIKVTTALELLLQKLCIDADSMVKLQQSLGSNPVIWNIKEAKDYLDAIVINAILGKSQLLKHKDWIVEVISKDCDLNHSQR